MTVHTLMLVMLNAVKHPGLDYGTRRETLFGGSLIWTLSRSTLFENRYEFTV